MALPPEMIINDSFMTWWQATILGVVEGITEYLPVSSTGHLIIASALLGLDGEPHQKEAIDAFNIVIQGGAILAVLGLYRERVLQIIRGGLGQDPEGLKLGVNLLIAFVPAAVLGLLLNHHIESFLFYAGPVLAALFLGGIYMMVIDHWKIKPHRTSSGEIEGTIDLSALTWQKALVIGLMQCIAMWPGTSRSMMTISAGVIVGLKPKQAAEFSFLLGLPTLGGACVYRLYKNMNSGGPNMFEVIGVVPIVVGMTVATVSAIFAVRWLVSFLTRHGLTPFGWYRIGLCAVMGVLWYTGIVQITPD